MTLAEWLRTTETRPADLAAKLGVHHSTIYRIGKGTKRPSLTLALAITQATGGAVTASAFAPAQATA